MPGNVYGTANPILVPTALAVVGGADVALPATTKTTVIASAALIAQSSGNYFPMAWGTMFIVLGATPPSALIVGITLGAGATSDSLAVEPGLLTANAELMIPFALVGPASNTLWASPGTIVNLTANPTGQAATAKLDSRAIVMLVRAPDA